MSEDHNDLSSPYRSAPYVEPRSAIRAQMTGAITILREWKKYNPVIAGGALWSWAAEKPANDIDIFARSSIWTRWRAERMYGPPSFAEANFNTRREGAYGSAKAGTGLQVFRTVLGNHHTKVDLVLTGRPSDGNHGMFDYAHCRVAWGLDWCSMAGASAYEEGRLVQLHHNARPEKHVLSKVQRDLWGSTMAFHRLFAVMGELSSVAGQSSFQLREFPTRL